MLYAIIIAAIVAVLLLKGKADTGGSGSGGTGGGSGTGGDVVLPMYTNLYEDKDGQLVLWGRLGNPITVTPLLDPTRPDYRYFNWTKSITPPRKK